MTDPRRPDCPALLAQLEWVRALARHLTADAHLADDLAQEAFAAALVRPPNEDRPLRGWLAGVVRNLVRQERRAAGHRRARERAVAREDADRSSAELEERLESHRAVVDAVARLDEPYRAAILLRYFEGLGPGAIARRTGTSVRTVHTRLHRALARLREDLDRAHGGGRRAWLLALIPYARGSGGGSTAAVGGLLMEAKLKLGIAALAAFGLCSTVVLLRRFSDGSEARPTAAGETTLARGADTAPIPADGPPVVPVPEERRAFEPRAARADDARAPDAPALEPLFEGRVMDAEHAPVAGLRVRLRSEDGRADREAVADASGAFTLPRPEADGTLEVATPGWTTLFRPGVAARGTMRELVLVVARSITLGGRVIDEDGRGLEGATVAVPLPFPLRARLEAALDGASSVERATTTDADGRFQLADVPVVSKVELVTSRPTFVEERRPLPPYDDLGLEIVLRALAAGPDTLYGRVVDEAGRGIEGAWVGLGHDAVKSGPNGGFALALDTDAAPGPRTLRAVKAGYLPTDRRIAEKDASEPLVLVLGPPPLTIDGRVVDATGAPVPAAEVWTDEETHFGFISIEGGEMTVRVGASIEGILRDDPWTHRVRADAEGRFELVGLLPRDYRLRAFDRKHVLLSTAVVAAGAEDVELRLPDEALWPRVAGRVAGLDGEPLPGMSVAVEREELDPGPAGKLESRPTKTDGDGRFSFEDVARDLRGVRVSGVDVGLGGFLHVLAKGEDPEALEIRVPLLVRARVDARGTTGADRAALLDAEGHALTLSLDHGEHAYAMDRLTLHEGRSESFSVSETATTLVLYDGERELSRQRITLARGELNLLGP